MSVGNTPSSAAPSRNANLGVAVCSFCIHFGTVASWRLR
jgi:hypothetical protein